MGGTVFKCICGYAKLVKYYYMYLDKLEGIYMYNLIYDICYSLTSVRFGKAKTCNMPKF